MSDASTFALMARLAISLGVVIGLMLLLSGVLKRRGLAPAARRQRPELQVELLARRPLGRNASIAIVRAGGKSMVLGVTDSQVTLLTEADVEEIDLKQAEAKWTAPPPGVESPGSAWRAMLERVREKTIRR